jgi:hypothetical protein
VQLIKKVPINKQNKYAQLSQVNIVSSKLRTDEEMW